MKNSHSLQTFVHRTLVHRLLIVTLILSLVFGIAVLFIERDRISDDVISIVMDNVSFFVSEYDYLLENPDKMDPEKLKQAIMEFKTGRTLNKLGTFISLSIYDYNNEKITEIYAEDINPEEIKKMKEVGKPGNSVVENSEHKLMFIGGMPCLRISIPFFNKSEKRIGSISTTFALSEEVIASSRARGLRVMIMAVAIILITSVTLYPIILRLTKSIIDYSQELIRTNLGTLETLGSAIAIRDNDTNAHNYRVSIYATRLGEKVGLPHKTMRTLIKGSFLHDVGKIGIPDEILLKPDKLTESEYEKIKTHVKSGVEIASHSTWLDDALEVIHGHHEKVSGEGYPLGLSGDKIPITARIFAIADVFDALTSKRPYKKAWSFKEAIKVMDEGKGIHFDAQLLEQFKEIAKALYESYGGKEDISRKELIEIIDGYFYKKKDALEI